MILNPAYNGVNVSSNGFKIVSDRDSGLSEDASYQVLYRGASNQASQIEHEERYSNIAENACYQASTQVPSTFDSVEQAAPEEPLGCTCSKRIKAKIGVAVMVTVAVAMMALVVLAIVTVLCINNQEIQLLKMDVENLKAQVGLNQTQGN